MSTLLLVSDSDELRLLISHAVADLDDLTLTVRALPESGSSAAKDAKELASNSPLVVVLDATERTAYMLEVAGELDRLRSDIGLVAVAKRTREAWEGALRAGVRELLGPTDDAGAFGEAIARVSEIAQRRRAERSSDEAASRTSRILAVMSPKGGAGKTMISTNLAVGLATVAPRAVVLIDLDLQFGDVANALRLTPDATIADAVPAGLVDSTALKVNLTSHPSGLYALCAPDDPGEADEIEAGHVARVVHLLADEFAWVVIDTDPGLGERTLAAIEGATDLIFVCGTDVASVRGLRKEMAALDRIGMTYQQRHFVLNRADARVGLSADDIATAIDMPVDVFVPSSRTVPLAMNQGNAIINSDEPSPASNPLWQLVNRFTPVNLDEKADERKGFLRRR